MEFYHRCYYQKTNLPCKWPGLQHWSQKVACWFRRYGNIAEVYFLHLIPIHLKDKISSSLFLGFEEFRWYVILTCDLDMNKPRDGARQGKCFKKQKQNQQFLYQRRNKLPDQQVICRQRHPKNSFSTCINKQNQLSSYQGRNKLPVQEVNYEKIHSRNLFGRCFKNQIISSHTKEVVKWQFNKWTVGRDSLSEQNCHNYKKFSRKYNKQRSDVKNKVRPASCHPRLACGS